MSFNKEQLQALNTNISKNVVVSAGAGSGKTKTLTQKVINILTGNNSQKLEPSELLILTFTNNAAHDMKRKIVEACQDLPNINEIITSAHIQTFDSFAGDLVRKYSSHLNISDNFNIISEDVYISNVRSYIDDIFKEYEDNGNAQLISSLKKTSLIDSENLKTIVFNVFSLLDKLLPEDKEKFISNSTNLFLSREYFDKMVDEWVLYLKNRIIFNIRLADLINTFPDAFTSIDNIEKFNNFYLDVNHFKKDYRKCDFSNNDTLLDAYEYLVDLLKLNGNDFLAKASYAVNYLCGKNEIFGKKLSDDVDDNVKDAWDILRKIVANKKALLRSVVYYGEFDATKHTYSLNKEYQRIISFKDDINFIFEIIDKLEEKLKYSQKCSGSYTFGDISKMALTLIKNNEEIADELREQFKFIMIDEYQDTNDLQEQFINVLLKPRKSDNGKASLFCVGDAKQSIYAFRNSNVALFNQRLNDPTTQKVFMNKNYRSGEKLLREINFIFKCYMSKDNGDIEYLQNDESLKYDYEVNLYNKPYDNFGVKRITLLPTPIISLPEYECYAIINDIKNKISDPNFLISERAKENVLRRANYSDFCILMRVKKGFDLYRRIFAKEGIKLNLVYSEDLQQADAIIAIQSLVSLIASINKEVDDVDVAHCFVSVVRSFLYSYSDQQILELLTDKGNIDSNSLERIYNDPTYKFIEQFAVSHKDTSVHQMMLDLFDEFDIFNKLVTIGSINDNIAKIESLYQTILTEENSGGDIKDFLYFLKNISQRNLGLNSDVEISTNDAVSMMTIHASKGLEKKIIYMPYSFNKIGGKGGLGGYVGNTSLDLGIILPDYTNDIQDEETSYETFYSLIDDILLNDKTASDEHVRLFYVALTRAENTVYIVGNRKNSDIKERSDGTLYGMYSYMPCWPKYSEKGLSILANRINPSYYANEIEPTISSYKKSFNRLYFKDFENVNDYDFYNYLYDGKRIELINNYVSQITSKPNNILFDSMFCELETLYEKGHVDLDLFARIYGYYKYGICVKTFTELIEQLKIIDENNKNRFVDEEGSSESDNSETINLDSKVTKSDILEFADKFVHGKENIKYFMSFDEEEEMDSLVSYADIIRRNLNSKNTPFELMDLFFKPCLYAFEGITCLYNWSYQSDEFEDDNYEFSIFNYERKIKVELPDNLFDNLKLDLDNNEIEFNERIKSRASKALVDIDEDTLKIMEKGTLYHRYMELVDFKTKDTSFIQQINDRKDIDKVLSMPLFDIVNHADKVYKEYPYYDEVLDTSGFIDLLYIKDGEYFIVDYKLKHTKDDDYRRQLEVYKRNITKLFNIKDESKIHLTLLSLIDCQLYKVC